MFNKNVTWPLSNSMWCQKNEWKKKADIHEAFLLCCNIHTVYRGSPQGHLNSHYPAWPFKSMALMSYECKEHIPFKHNEELWRVCSTAHRVLLFFFFIITAVINKLCYLDHIMQAHAGNKH